MDFRVGRHDFPVPEAVEPEGATWESLASLAATYLHDAHDYWFHRYQPRAGDVIVDIGAGRGEDTLAFSRAVGDEGRVFALEAHPLSFAALEKFCALNGLANVTVLNLACVDAPCRLQIGTLPNWQSNAVRTGDPSAGSLTVDGVPFDWVWRQHEIGAIDFLKMNIEGAERLALPGCRRALEHTRQVCIAAHDFRANRGEEEWYRTAHFVREALTEAGFHLTPRDDARPWPAITSTGQAGLP